MQSIDRGKFMFAYQQEEFGTLNPTQMTALAALLDFLEADEKVTDPRHSAYMLATALHETAGTYRPIAEYGHGAGRPYGNPDSGTGLTYYGRGYVQLTWAGNYKTMGQAVGEDLYHNPDLAMDPETAYKIMSYGMRHGSFTGVGLSHYISGDKCDFLNARKIINWTDCAQKIADYAEKINSILQQSVIQTG